MKTTTEIIEETASFYTSKNRGYNTAKGCMYRTFDGKKCAVGRCILDEKLDMFAPLRGSILHVAAALPDKEPLDNFLKPEYRGHSLKFWYNIQNLHDMEDNWDSNGITPEGIEYKEQLLSMDFTKDSI